MATATAAEEPVVDVDPDAHRERTYVTIALILALLTVAEVATFYLPDAFGGEGSIWFNISLLVLMAVKFGLVASFFMHLKFDKKILTGVFYAGIALALLVYLCVLMMFRYFGDEVGVPQGAEVPVAPVGGAGQ